MYKKIPVLLLTASLLGGCEMIAENRDSQNSHESNDTFLAIEDYQNDTSDSSESEQPELTPEEEEAAAREELISQLPDVSTDDWNLILVNNETPIDPSIEIPFTVLSNGLMVDERMAEEYEAWINAAAEAGHNIVLVSSYRSVDLQTKNYNDRISSYMEDGYSEEEAVTMTEEYIAVPGGSEHHTGLALDLLDEEWLSTGQGLVAEYDTQESQQWLAENAAEYGFILRFPEGKEEETGIAYESWHFRYVGRENAEFMQKNDLVLEEYIELLKEAGQ